jgi:hypothetical protein
MSLSDRLFNALAAYHMLYISRLLAEEKWQGRKGENRKHWHAASLAFLIRQNVRMVLRVCAYPGTGHGFPEFRARNTNERLAETQFGKKREHFRSGMFGVAAHAQSTLQVIACHMPTIV